MRFFLLLPLCIGFFSPMHAAVDPKVRKACLPAADFEGCVRAFTQKELKTEQFDFLDKPVIKGWRMVEDRPENRVFYVNDADVRKVKVRGVFGRYIKYEYVQRWYQEAIAGTSGSSTTIGSASTNCYGSNYYGSTSMNCTTTPATTINIPGRSAINAGVRQQRTSIVIDCLERKAKWIPGENKKWNSIKGKVVTEPLADQNCPIINSLKVSSYMKWAAGTPNKSDKRALEILPRKTN